MQLSIDIYDERWKWRRNESQLHKHLKVMAARFFGVDPDASEQRTNYGIADLVLPDGTPVECLASPVSSMIERFSRRGAIVVIPRWKKDVLERVVVPARVLLVDEDGCEPLEHKPDAARILGVFFRMLDPRDLWARRIKRKKRASSYELKRARWNIKCENPVIRIPKPVIESFFKDDESLEIEMAAASFAAAIYPRNVDKRLVIKSLKLIIEDLKNELELEKAGSKKGGETSAVRR